ncbi:MAG: 50S ribosomal protein L11 methyltransferase [Gammaproteobacteria bacterium]|nr:50S ribosomal protein L11 methyltransferase [Gammaproteobacteria bacterium]MBU1480397.1 50S ribosomal protein L11 methyltransferase [Gammaproteobacteria bacterium]
MSWLTLSVRAEAGYAEALSEALLARGALSVDMLDADADTPDEQAIFGEPGELPPKHITAGSSGAREAAERLLPQTAGYASNVSQPHIYVWQHNLVNALFENDADVAGILQACYAELGINPLPEYSIDTLEENDWVRLTQAQFDPIRISQRLWIVPTWHTPTDPAAINIALDPGLAFGTGSHPTTRLCLRWLDENIKGGETVLDYGCGSGILAIAAMKLGAASAVGVDVDAQAVVASRDNALANQVRADFYLPDGAVLSQYDVVVANILTNPLCALAPLLAAATKSGGRIVLSGILAEQAEEVMRIYTQWFDLAPAVLEDGWCCVSGTKR